MGLAVARNGRRAHQGPRPARAPYRQQGVVVVDAPRGINYHSNRAAYVHTARAHHHDAIVITDKPDTVPPELDAAIIAVDDTLDPGCVEAAIEDICDTHTVRALLPGFEDQQLLAAAARDRFGIPGVGLSVASLFSDKSDQHRALRGKGYSYDLPDAIDELPRGVKRSFSVFQETIAQFAATHGYPVIIKHRRSSGSNQVYSVMPEDLSDIWKMVKADPTSYRVERFIVLEAGRHQMHVDGFFQKGRPVELVASEYTYNLLGSADAACPGTITRRFDQSPRVQAAIAATIEIVAELDPNMTDFVHFEYFDKTFGEGARRMIGGPGRHLFEAITGFNMARTQLSLLLNPNIDPATLRHPINPRVMDKEVGVVLLRSDMPGRIVQIGGAETLTRHADVIDAQITAKKNDLITINDKRSAASLGHALVTGDGREAIFARMQELQDSFLIQTVGVV